MKKGTFELAEQIGDYGFYGKVELSCTVGNSFPDRLNLIVPEKFKRWQNGIAFGAQYFLEHVASTIQIKVEVTNVEFNDVDSTNTIFAYVTFNALLNASQLQVRKQIIFDRENKCFVFPK